MTTTAGVSGGRSPEDAGHPSRPPVIAFPAITFLIATNLLVAFLLPIAFKRDYPANPIRLGADWRPLSFSTEWWRLITSSFVHIEVLHLLGNMVGLWIFGKRVERLLGSLGVLAFYLGCAMLGNVIALLMYPTVVGYGASLAVVGLAGILAVVYGRRFALLSTRAKWKYGLLVLFVAGLVRHEFADTHYFVHTVGLLIGVTFALVLECLGSRNVNRYWASMQKP